MGKEPATGSAVSACTPGVATSGWQYAATLEFTRMQGGKKSGKELALLTVFFFFFFF